MNIEYIDHMGSDLTVVNAARVSMDKESEWELHKKMSGAIIKELSDKDVKLIYYLSKHNHFTPFTHCTITLRETVPIFVARQRFKHTVGFTYNEVSRRYVDDTPKFYQPDVWRKRAENVKQGSSNEEIIENLYGGDISYTYNNLMQRITIFYKDLIDSGVAPEQARMVLPQSMYTSYYVTGSLAAFARAYKLRSDPHAQKEIRDLATEWDKIISPLFPESWKVLADA